MAQKSKPKRVILEPDRRSDKFTREESLKAIREIAAARRGRKRGVRSHATK